MAGKAKRMEDILNFLSNLESGIEVTQEEIMTGINASPGQWVQVKQWLNLLVWIQAQPMIERRFIPRKSGVTNFMTKYHIKNDNISDNKQ